MSVIQWDLPDEYSIDLEVCADDIDEYGHTNNSVYLRWLDAIAWAHADAVGAGRDAHLSERRGMANRRTELQFVAPCFEGDRVRVGNWIVYCDGRLRATRRFQIVRVDDGATLLRAVTHYVCIDIDSGRPKRMPDSYSSNYVMLPTVESALAERKWPFALSREGRG